MDRPKPHLKTRVGIVVASVGIFGTAGYYIGKDVEADRLSANTKRAETYRKCSGALSKITFDQNSSIVLVSSIDEATKQECNIGMLPSLGAGDLPKVVDVAIDADYTAQRLELVATDLEQITADDINYEYKLMLLWGGLMGLTVGGIANVILKSRGKAKTIGSVGKTRPVKRSRNVPPINRQHDLD